MYTDGKAPLEIRGQAQSMLVFFTQGIGMYIGYSIAGKEFARKMTNYKVLQVAIHTDLPTEEPEITFLQQLGKMFSVTKPEDVDPELLSTTMSQWQSF